MNATQTEAGQHPYVSSGHVPEGSTSHIKMIPAPDFGEVFTISLHQQNNYPTWKPPSFMDVNLPDGVGDEEYLECLGKALSSAFRQFTPELIAYVADADPYRYDQLGGLGLSIKGLKKREEMAFCEAKKRNIPVSSLCQAATRKWRRHRDHPLQHNRRGRGGIRYHKMWQTETRSGSNEGTGAANVLR